MPKLYLFVEHTLDIKISDDIMLRLWVDREKATSGPDQIVALATAAYAELAGKKDAGVLVETLRRLIVGLTAVQLIFSHDDKGWSDGFVAYLVPFKEES
jgi:hypothetical protein